MIASIFGYSIVVALLGGLAAASAELVLAEFRCPRRFAWLGAFAVALAFPPLAWVLAPVAPAALVVASAEPLQQLRAPYPAIDWDTTLVALWVATTTTLLVLYAAAWLRLSLLANRWPRETSDATPIVVADDVGPAVLGIRRPRIVLPRWLMQAPVAVRSAVIAHELEHIAARDQASIVAAQLVTILLPWNLPLWWFVRRLRAAIEVDCDARVLRRGVDAAHYADVLLTVGQRGTTSPFVGTALIEPITQLEWRIRTMLTKRGGASVGRTSAAAVALVVLAACATQLKPPVVIADSAPSAVNDTATAIEINAPGGFTVSDEPDGQVTMLAAEIHMRVAGTNQMRITSERVVTNGDSLLFEGDVRIDSDQTSITAARALATKTPNGEMVLTVEDAKVIRTFAPAATSSE
jgi:bla regulator protein BlaR1